MMEWCNFDAQAHKTGGRRNVSCQSSAPDFAVSLRGSVPDRSGEAGGPKGLIRPTRTGIQPDVAMVTA